MATHKSAEKRVRQTLKRRDRNRTVKSHVRTLEKAFRQAADGGDADQAATKLRATERAMRRAASKGVLPKSQVSRRVSRLAKRLNQV